MSWEAMVWTCFSGHCTAGQGDITRVTLYFSRKMVENYHSGIKLFVKVAVYCFCFIKVAFVKVSLIVLVLFY